MNNRTKLGLNILEAALLLGVLGDALLRETPWGLNVPLWTGALAAAMYALHARGEAPAAGRADGSWLWLPVFFFAAAFAWRDSATLKLLDGLALFAALALLAWRARGGKIRLGGLADYALGLGHAAFDALFASVPLVTSDVQWATIPRHGAMRHAWAAARGLVIAVPLLFLFGGLFVAADAVFEDIMRRTFLFDIGELFSHFFIVLSVAWMTGGFLCGMMLTGETAGAVSAETAGAASETAPGPYTSITVEDKKRDASARGAEGADASSEHRRSPGSVVVEGGAKADGESDTVNDRPNSNDRPKSDADILNGDADMSNGDADMSNGDANARSRASGARASGAAFTAHAATGQTAAGLAAATGRAAVTTQAAAHGGLLGAVEVGVVLGLLNVLFACFVVVQFGYFFGGAARVMSMTELTYSEYARRGFFELTWVAGLVLPLLLGAHALLRKDSPAAGRIFRALAGVQVGLLFVIMASAVARMRLYQSEYGLTELRLYTTAFMLWLGLVFVWFAWTVLVRGARERFACGALVAAFATVVLLHLVNPDAYIVRANAAHARAGRSFDAEYAASLSADAVPALISVLPTLNGDERCLAGRVLLRGWTSDDVYDEDWRAWNFARWRARRAVATHRHALSEATCPPPANSMPLNAPPTASPTAPEPPPPPAPVKAAIPASTTTDNAHAATARAGERLLATTEAKGAGTEAANAARSVPREGKARRRKRTRAAARMKTL
jgi:hypothetical protein